MGINAAERARRSYASSVVMWRLQALWMEGFFLVLRSWPEMVQVPSN
jgi:hypothetical protein